MANYTSNYIKNYIFQILATGIGLLSLFVVVPYISGDKSLYGIYSICVSLTIFVNYADLGFLTAGQKFAAESYAKGNLEEERRYVGFTLYVLLLFVSFVLLCFVPIAIKPSLLISDLDDCSAAVASSLIWIIILFSPVLAIKRVLFLAYAVSPNPFSDRLVIRESRWPMRRAIKEVKACFKSLKPLTYAQLQRLFNPLTDMEKAQLVDYIINLYF